MRDSQLRPLQDLAQAPDMSPPASLWPRVREGQRKALLRRRVLRGASASAMALLLVALVPWSSLQVTEPATGMVAAQGSDDVREQIVSIDRALQAAYDRGASDDEVAPMWDARSVLVARMVPAGAGREDAQGKGI